MMEIAYEQLQCIYNCRGCFENYEEGAFACAINSKNIDCDNGIILCLFDQADQFQQHKSRYMLNRMLCSGQDCIQQIPATAVHAVGGQGKGQGSCRRQPHVDHVVFGKTPPSAKAEALRRHLKAGTEIPQQEAAGDIEQNYPDIFHGFFISASYRIKTLAIMGESVARSIISQRFFFFQEQGKNW